ncbi:MAG TPA: CRISPR-associated endonuclease Cas3'' [Minicystis sp.]|nr:CRISPR-associated endonuclease Cas3'' [Minicystis sp.]
MTTDEEPMAGALAHAMPTGERHALIDHLEAVGGLAARFADAFGAASFARVAGLWHDLGKYAADFQRMIRAANGFEAHLEQQQGKIDHSSAGAVHAATCAPGAGGQVLAFVIAGHHAGLANRAPLAERLLKKRERLAEALHGGAPRALLDEPVPREVPFPVSPRDARSKRRLEMWIRMLFSALCDADFLDTEAFFQPDKARARELDAGIAELGDALGAHLDGLEKHDTEVNRARADVRRACVAAARQPPGVFTLTVPTGGGKTLASMAFALEHARTHGKDRVIVAIPFTSIIEQSAAVFRDAFAGLGERAVLEHHAAFDPARETLWNRVASENWDAPIVVTTTAQLFDSLFARRPSACRKLHRLANSVIVLDEAQTLPPKLLDPILDALHGLVDHYGASVVVCTATQPAFAKSLHLPEGFERVREIARPELDLFERLRRVEVRFPPTRNTTSYEELSTELAKHADVLAIVHRRADARRLAELVDRASAESTIHLSALMCPAHRSEVLADLKARRCAGAASRVVSTQLVEAGVDVDFPVVYRALAGAEAIAQAAGRCNREGKLSRLGQVVVFRAETSPPPGVLRQGLQVFSAMLAADPGLDPFAPATFDRYFRSLYAVAARDGEIQEARTELRFEDTARFSLIEDGWSAPIVVRYGGADPLLARVRRDGPNRFLMRALQRFTVAVPKKLRDEWLARGTAETIAETVVAVAPGVASYDDRFGLLLEAMGTPAADAFIV